jgi:Tfp pilus tip-associated adhesin PilY1
MSTRTRINAVTVTPRRQVGRPRQWLLLVAAAAALWTTNASAQLDPLLFLKRIPPNVLFMIDMGPGMLSDAAGAYYDPNQYKWSNQGGDLAWQTALGLLPGVNIQNQNNAPYYRKFVNRTYTAATNVGGVTYDFAADSIVPVGNLASGYSTFYEPTRLMIARRALTQVIDENTNTVRFSLMKTRQTSAAWGTAPNNKLANDAAIIAAAGQVTSDTGKSSGGRGIWYYMKTTVSGNNAAAASSTATVVAADAANANTTVRADLAVPTNPSSPTAALQVSNGLIPASNTTVTQTDRPLGLMLDDAKTEVTRLITADTVCRNNVVVMVVAGGEGTTTAGATAATTAAKGSNFLNVSSRHVPVYVIAIAPAASESANLALIATNSGGKYFEITAANITATPTGSPVPEFVKAVNYAVQHSFQRYAECNSNTTESEFQVTSPIAGTVNLESAKDINGTTLSDTKVYDKEGNLIPQRTNVLVTTGFELPGFEGRLRAFRVYKPVADSTKSSGYKFSQDGTRLWVACAPGTTTSGACSSLATSARNIYTSLPDGTLVKFDSTQATTLAPYLAGTDTVPSTFSATNVIDTVRALPLGALVSSTPAIMDPPSLDPPPDADYPAFAIANKDRRSIVWICANDGMLHAIDARLGIEVWAYIPFNLLPKLKTLADGQPVGQFDYLMDGSPKVADVKISGAWKTYLIVGQGAGGTFYQAFDVTLEDMAQTTSPTDNSISSSLTYFSSATRVPLKWSFPRMSKFDYTILYTRMSDGSVVNSDDPRGVAVYGDISSTATTVEKTVGQTWSDPAVGQAVNTSGKFIVIAGSGFLSYTQQHHSNRGDVVAGTSLYLIDIETGLVDASKDIGSDGTAETVDDCAASSVNNCQVLKNALHADPVATGPPDSRFINKVYIGDLDGRVWRFNIQTDTSGTPSFTSDPVMLFNASLTSGHGSPKKVGAAQPLFSSMASVTVGGTQQYIFFGTGSDLLPSNGVNQAYQLIGFLDDGVTGVQSFALNLTAVANSTADEEKVTAFPAVAGDIVFFTTTTFHAATPCVSPDANLYALTYIGGAAYDTTGDGAVSGADSVKAKTVTGARATAPFVVDQHLFFSAGTKAEMFGDPNDYNNGVGQVGVRILSWREVR